MYPTLPLAAPIAFAATAAAMVISHTQPSNQLPINPSMLQDGPGPFNAEQSSSKASFPSWGTLSPLTDPVSPATTLFDLCSGPEGTIQTINNNEYRTYCYNSLWGSYVGLGYWNTVEECESQYTSSSVSPKVGYHWYPSTGACYLFNRPTDELYVYHYGNYEKVFFAPVETKSLPDGPLCPLPQEGGFSWIGGQLYQLYCRGMAKADAQDIKSYANTVDNATQCADWANGVGGKMWHYWQPYQDAVPGLATGQRNCEAIMKMPDHLVPLRTKDTYIAGVPYYGSTADVVDMYAAVNSGW